MSQCPRREARLEAAIASAAMSGSLGGAGGGVRLPRPRGRADWLALVTPCPKYLDHLPVRMPAAVLRIVETDPSAGLSAAHSELFDLTARELDVADALLRGHSVETLCHALGISRNTAKAHLQSLLAKPAPTVSRSRSTCCPTSRAPDGRPASALDRRHQAGVAAGGGSVDAGHPLGREAGDVVRAAGLRPGAAQPLAAERLATHDRADLVAVDIDVADPGGASQSRPVVDPAVQPAGSARSRWR